MVDKVIIGDKILRRDAALDFLGHVVFDEGSRVRLLTNRVNANSRDSKGKLAFGRAKNLATPQLRFIHKHTRKYCCIVIRQ